MYTSSRAALMISAVNAAVLVAVIAGGSCPHAEPIGAVPEATLPDDEKSRIAKLLQWSLDAALRQYVQKQFHIWMADPSEQPQRAGKGVRRAVQSYRDASAVLAREFAAAGVMVTPARPSPPAPPERPPGKRR